MRAAMDEFAAHGFHDASLNRVIESAGISKGSMYYYFNGKEDLYAYVARTGLAGLFARVGLLRRRTPRSRPHRVTSSRHHCPGSSRPSLPANAWEQCATICPPPC